MKEFWYFVRSEVKKLANVDPGERQKYADALLQDLGHQERWAASGRNAQVLGPPWFGVEGKSGVSSKQAVCFLLLWFPPSFQGRAPEMRH